MSAANDDLDNDAVTRNMLALYVNDKVGQCLHQLLVKQADAVPALEVFAPGFVVIAGGIAKGGEYTFEVMRIFVANMLLNQGHAGCGAILLTSATGNWRAAHN
jgi:hypothetical protein